MPYYNPPYITIYQLKSSTSATQTRIYCNIKAVAICDQYESLIWDTEYYDSGSFEICAIATKENLEKFQIGYVVGRSDEDIDDERTELGIIERVEIAADIEDGDNIIITGRFLDSLLDRRYIASKLSSNDGELSYIKNFSGQKDSIGIFMWYVLRRSGCNPYTAESLTDYEVNNYFFDNYYLVRRSLPGMNTPTLGDWSEVFDTLISDINEDNSMQVSWKNLHDWVYKAAKKVGGSIRAHAVGLKSPETNQTLQLVFWQGEDKSDSIIFSDDLYNLESINYAEDATEEKNYCYVVSGSQISEADFITPVYSGNPRYYDLKETIGYSSENTYESVISERYIVSAEQFKERKIASEAEIVNANIQWTYKQDYFVGDKVSFRYEKLGLSIEGIRLTGMIESWSKDGYQLIPTFQFDEDDTGDDDE